MIKNIISALAILLLSSNNVNANDGEELFKAKCASCHTMTRPEDKSTLIAPPVMGLMYHMKENFKSKEEVIAHINSFVMNPTKEKAVCKSVRRFGVMPSQKGLLTTEELNTIALWMTNSNAKNCESKNPN